MTPKEKAKELVKKFWMDTDISSIETAKKCALILIDEIFETIDWHITDIPYNELDYWKEVQQEIEKL
jgi:hypothetical protein